MNNCLTINSHRVLALASAFALWAAAPSVGGAAMPGGGIGSAVGDFAASRNPVTSIHLDDCGPRCSGGEYSILDPNNIDRDRSGKHFRRYCVRYDHRDRRKSHYHCGLWYSMPFWAAGAPLNIHDVYDNDDPHIAYCLKKYRSYDPATDTYLAYSGRVRRCRSPYSGQTD